jgi:hypothetical protein
LRRRCGRGRRPWRTDRRRCRRDCPGVTGHHKSDTGGDSRCGKPVTPSRHLKLPRARQYGGACQPRTGAKPARPQCSPPKKPPVCLIFHLRISDLRLSAVAPGRTLRILASIPLKCDRPFGAAASIRPVQQGIR